MKDVTKKGLRHSISIFTLLPGFQARVLGQFEINGQIVERSEIRHGYDTLIPKDSMPAAFVTSRARIELSYKSDKVRAHTSVQDVRV